MTDNLNLSLAIKLAAEVHDSQKDKAGEDYILHPLAVMEMVRTHSSRARRLNEHPGDQ